MRNGQLSFFASGERLANSKTKPSDVALYRIGFPVPRAESELQPKA
jgi:hypothetical protein